MGLFRNAGLALYNLTHHQYTVDEINDLKPDQLRDKATQKKIEKFCTKNDSGNPYQKNEAYHVREALNYRIKDLNINVTRRDYVPDRYPDYTKFIPSGFDEPTTKATNIWQKFLNLIHKNKE